MFKSESVMLIGEGEYNINNVKQLRVTKSFLGLDEENRVCQNKESIHNCTTRKHLDTILESCGCLPVNIWFSEKVFFCL